MNPIDPLDIVPIEISSLIISELSATDIKSCLVVSKRWNELANSDDVWRILAKKNGFHESGTSLKSRLLYLITVKETINTVTEAINKRKKSALEFKPFFKSSRESLEVLREDHQKEIKQRESEALNVFKSIEDSIDQEWRSIKQRVEDRQKELDDKIEAIEQEQKATLARLNSFWKY